MSPGTGYNFTERVRKVLAMSREEAARLKHEYVGTEHILLGLLREGAGVASSVLANLKISPDALRARLESAVKIGNPKDPPTGPDLPYTSRAKKVLELAMRQARELGHSYVGTEHLLLGLVDEEKGIGAHVLIEAGVTLENARAEVIKVLGTGPTRDREEPRSVDGLMGNEMFFADGRRVLLRRGVWFRPWGWIHRPVSLAGWVITVLATAFVVQVFVAVDRNSHSVSDTLYGIFPFVGVAFLLWNWIASRSSR